MGTGRSGRRGGTDMARAPSSTDDYCSCELSCELDLMSSVDAGEESDKLLGGLDVCYNNNRRDLFGWTGV